MPAMTEYPKTLAALREQEDRSWTVADALVEEIKTYQSGKVVDGEFVRCAAWLSEQSYEAKADYLSRLRNTARKFPPSEGGRGWHIPFRLYMEAAESPSWTPEFMDRAESDCWTLREFSRELTGKRWSDDDVEATKRVLRDPERTRQVAEEMEIDEIAGAVNTLRTTGYSSPQDAETQERIRRAELVARERELAEQDDMDRILGSTEILRDLFGAVDAVEKFVTRWSKRGVKLADAETNVYRSGVASLRLAVDQIERIGEGRESLEEELQRITQEQP